MPGKYDQPQKIKKKSGEIKMSELFFQCDRGAAGDIISAALMELVPDQEKMLDKLNSMGIPGVNYVLEKKEKYGMTGNTMTVMINGEIEEDAEEEHHTEHGGYCINHETYAHEAHTHGHHHEEQEHETHVHHHENHGGHCHQHMTMEKIRKIVDELQVSEKIRQNIMGIYQIIAKAESEAHSCTVSEVHFHEVGAMDAIADIAAVCALVEELNPSEISASQINVGNGTIECAHGILPVPAPATANILHDVPYDTGDIDGEICTPTGAALLKYFVNRYEEEKPHGNVKNGVGFGKRTFSTPSYFKAYLV